MALEIGGFGKEHAVDQFIAFAKQSGINHGLVDPGRDVDTPAQTSQGECRGAGIEDARQEDASAYRLDLLRKRTGDFWKRTTPPPNRIQQFWPRH